MLRRRQIFLSTAYLPNIQYFSKLLSGDEIIIETQDNYQKQSFRNRTVIYGANGPLDLVIPVKRPQGNNTKTRDILLNYDMPWMANHWKAIVSAYKHSAFFEIFEAEFEPYFQRQSKYLLEWNFSLLEGILKIAGLTSNYTSSNEYLQVSNDNQLDYRESIHPKKRMRQPDVFFKAPSYFQVFADKHGFEKNLSFIDLLFNEGSEAAYLCRKSITK